MFAYVFRNIVGVHSDSNEKKLHGLLAEVSSREL
jgi:hypothetical protein